MGTVEHIKLRMKIGAHEFEAEGPHDVVMTQLEIWSRLAGLPPASSTTDRSMQPADSDLAALFTVDPDRQAIALNTRLAGRTRNADAALLLLYGHPRLLGGDGRAEIPAPHLRAAVAASGHRVQRLDRVLTRYLSSGLVRKSGRRRHETYALTPAGIQRAATLVRRLAANL
jgi:hypothetical protein